MRFLTRMMFAVCLLSPVVSQSAVVWSTCQTITAVDNYLAQSTSQLILVLSPGVSGCSNASATGAVSFEIGQDGITSSNVNYILATTLSAFVAGKRVMIAYDNSTAQCYSQIIAIGGYAAQCP
ncbi:MAG: hypothetical protein WA642_15165 [Steroidobacteraceae bacterium]